MTTAAARDVVAALISRPIAHRGLHGGLAPENSLPAVSAAVAGGYAIEVDLRRTRDGRVVVFHDAELARMCGVEGRVDERALADLAGARLSGGDAPIPTLDDVLDGVAGRAALFLELKVDARTDVDALVCAVSEALEAYDGPVALMSFDVACVAACGRLAPDRARGLVSARVDDLWATAEACGASFVSLDQALLTTAQAQSLRTSGTQLITWTVTSAAQAARARPLADQITFEGFMP